MRKSMKTPLDVRREISARLKKAREAAGYATAEEFCRQHQLSPEIYLSHENAVKSIKASQAVRYCKLLKISLGQFYIGEKITKDS